jgi:formate-dependent nitrite reductase complex subunit NrfG
MLNRSLLITGGVVTAITLGSWWWLKSPVPAAPDSSLVAPHAMEDAADPMLEIQGALRENPNDGLSWLELGKFYLFSGELESALTCFDYSRRLLPNNADAWSGGATALYYINKQRITPDVEQALNTALSLDPDNESALTLLAADAFVNFEYAQAIEYWEQIIESDRLGVDRERLIGLIHQAEELMQ